MSFYKAWDALKAKQPKLTDPAATVEITSRNFERLLQQFYDAGADEERKKRLDAETLRRKPTPRGSIFDWF